MRCKLCGHVFDKTVKNVCKGCSKCNCKMVRCPNCGYENLPARKTELKFSKYIKKRLKNIKS